MPIDWDGLLRRLVDPQPQAFVSWLLEGAQFESVRERRMEGRVIEADLLYNVFWKGKYVILHVEFQTWHDSRMGRRMWEYNCLASCISGLPVCSVVIYLHEDDGIVEPPYTEELPNGDVNHIFYYKSIKLWEIPTETIKETGIVGMLPLLPLTKNGARHEVVEDMITSLKAAQRNDLLVVAYEFASLVFTDDADQHWLKRRIKMLDEIVKNTWAYKDLMEQAREDVREIVKAEVKEEVKAEVKEEVKREIKLETVGHTIVRFVEKRFPELASVARQCVERANDHQILDNALDALMEADDIEDAQRILTNIDRLAN